MFALELIQSEHGIINLPKLYSSAQKCPNKTKKHNLLDTNSDYFQKGAPNDMHRYANNFWLVISYCNRRIKKYPTCQKSCAGVTCAHVRCEQNGAPKVG